MSFSIISKDLIASPKPWWQPFATLLITLGSILFLNSNLSQIVFLFWWELVLLLGFALLRAALAHDGRPWSEHLIARFGTLLFGTVMSVAFILLSVTFTFKGIQLDRDLNGSFNIVAPLNALKLSYSAGFVLHFLLNNRYQTANPTGELMQPFVQILITLAILQVFTMHLLPAYPALDSSKWTVIALVVIKFWVDWGWGRLQQRT